MPEDWPVKSDYNSKWVIGAWAEAKGVCGFDLKIFKKTLFTGTVSKLQKKVRSWGGCTPPPCMPKGLKVSSYTWGKKCI